MALKIEPLKEEDMDEFIRTFWSAFNAAEADTVMPMIYPLGLQPDVMSRMRDRIVNEAGSDREKLCFVVKEPSTGEIIAISWWAEVMNPPKTKEEVESAYEQKRSARAGMTPVEGSNMALGGAFFKAAWFLGNEVVGGRPYMKLSLLAADPQFGRRGAGTMLLKQGLQRADDLDLPVFLEATKMGKPLYERYGFETKAAIPFDGREYGANSPGTHWCMWRPARSEMTNGS